VHDDSHILEQLHDSRDDWSVSPDAMRCGAPPEAAGVRPGRVGRAPQPGLVERMAPHLGVLVAGDCR
jgi:hypothetical protein